MRMIADVSTLFLSTPSARRATRSIVCMPDGAPFLSTPSSRRATSCGLLSVFPGYISIHALLAEGDASLRSCSPFLSHFYPRPPRGGRHPAAHPAERPFPISIHALLAEGD